MSNITSTIHMSLIGWKFNEIAQYLIISIFLLCLTLVKIIHSKIIIFSKSIPESLLLLFVGSMFGLIIRFVIHHHLNLNLTPEIFFFVLLPPIILDASYGLATRSFAKVLHFVLTLSIIGTIFTFLLLGLTFELGKILYIFQIDIKSGYLWLFSSIIVAIDPVAILAIFNDIGVKPELYFTLFGESLINDGVTVVLYEFISYITNTEFDSDLKFYFIGFASFLTVSLGGLLIGSIMGIISCLITRFRVNYEVVVLMLFGYLSYIVADLIKWSGIISIMCCGIIQACYAFHNITSESLLVLRKTVSFWCSMSEGVIFLFLGEKLVYLNIGWNTVFIFWTVFSCLLTRFVVVFIIFGFVKLISQSECVLNLKEQLILSYSGLRGAVAFSLVILLQENRIGKEIYELFVSTVLFLILFSIGFQGLTMKLFIKLLKITKINTNNMCLFKVANEFVIDHTMACIDSICGEINHNKFREWWTDFNDYKVKPILQCYTFDSDEKLLAIMQRISLDFHLKTINSNLSSKRNYSGQPKSLSNDDTIHTSLLNERKIGKKPRECVSMSSTPLKKSYQLNLSRMFTSMLENHRETRIIRNRMNKDPEYLANELNKVNKVRQLSIRYTTRTDLNEIKDETVM